MDFDSSTIYFAKTKPNAIIPSKREEDAGYDLYSCFDADHIIIEPNTITLIPTGIATAFASDYVLIVKERSSTGAKGLSVRMGVIDSGYRGEIILGINNTNNKPIIITKNDNFNDDRYIVHFYKKAIAQGVLIPIPKLKKKEVQYDVLLQFESERKKTSLGASGK